MKNTNVKLITLFLGLLFLMTMIINLPQALQGGSKYEDYSLIVRGSEYLLMGRKIKSLKPMDNETKNKSRKGSVSSDSAKGIDKLMRGDYPSRMKGRKRTPIHN